MGLLRHVGEWIHLVSNFSETLNPKPQIHGSHIKFWVRVSGLGLEI